MVKKAEEVELISTIMRKIWLRRNERVLNGKFSSPSQVTREAKECPDEFHQATSIRISSMQRRVSGLRDNSKWSKPCHGFIKVNWDDALD